MRRTLGVIALLFCSQFVTPRHAFSAVSADTVRVGDWPGQGVVVTPRRVPRAEVQALSDGNGGVFIGWREGSGAEVDLFLTRLTRSGDVAPGWGAQGIRIGRTRAPQAEMVLMSDHADGILATWVDNRPGAAGQYLIRVLPDGSVASGWDALGKLILPVAEGGYGRLCEDRSGGAYLLWLATDTFGQGQLHLRRYNSAGEVHAAWPASGAQITNHPQLRPIASIFCLPIAVNAGPEGHVYVESSLSSNCSGHGCIPSYREGVLMVHGLTPAWEAETSNGTYRWTSVTDGVGFLFRSSENSQSGNRYFVRLDPSGGWGSAPAVMQQNFCKLLPDGSGGVYVYSLQRRIQVAHVNASAGATADWGGSSGLLLIDPPFDPVRYLDGVWATLDNAGGLFFVWRNPAPTGYALYATSVGTNGVRRAGWAAVGNLVRFSPINVNVSAVVASDPGSAIVVWSDVDSSEATQRVMAQRLTIEQPVPTQVSLVSSRAVPGSVSLDWYHGSEAADPLTIERAEVAGAWRTLSAAYVEGDGHVRLTDHDVRSGTRYGYRLREGEQVSAEVWVEVPLRTMLGIRSAAEQGPGRVRVEFTAAPGQDAEVGLFDLAGRRIGRTRLAVLTDEPQSVEIAMSRPLASGLYVVRVTAGAESARMRLLVAR